MRAGRLNDLRPQVTRSVAATSPMKHSPDGENRDVAVPEESFEETRFEEPLSAGGDEAFCLPADLLPKKRLPQVCLFPDVVIEC